MNNYFLLVVCATWRVTSLFVREDGPLDLFAKIREKAGVYYDEYGVPQGKNTFARAMTCMWCFSLWVSPVMALFASPTSPVDWFAKTLALSAATILFDEALDRIISK